MTKTIRAHLALVGVALIYGANYTIAREVMNGYLEPLGFILLRAASAMLLFWGFSFFQPIEQIDRKDITRIVLCALFGVAANQMLFFSGLQLTKPINASLIMTITPLMVLLIAAVILKEKITRQKLFGILLGLSGAVLVISYGQSMDFQITHIKGDLMILANAGCYGTYLVLVKSLMKRFHPFTILKWIFTIGFFMVLPFGIGQLEGVAWETFPLPIWSAIAYVLIIVSFLSYLLNAFALKTLRASVAGIYIFLQPIMATLVALLAGRDSLSAAKIFAAVLIFCGVYLVSRGHKPDTNNKR